MTISLSQTNEQIIVVTYRNTHLNRFINYLSLSSVLPLLQYKENEPFSEFEMQKNIATIHLAFSAQKNLA